MATLFIMVGIPGSEKSTIVADIAKKYRCTISCPDTFRGIYSPTHDEADQSVNAQAWAAANQLVASELKHGRNVILDATNIYAKGRKNVFNLVPIGTNVIAVRVKTKLSTALARNASRKRNVPEEVVTRMNNTLVEPSLSEGFSQIIVINNG